MKGNLSPSLPPNTIAARDPFFHEAHRAFRDWITDLHFPCVGAKAAFNAETYQLAAFDRLGSDEATKELCCELFKFASSPAAQNEYATFIAVFREPVDCDEAVFEKLMWEQLAKLNRADAGCFPWDASVQSDPADPHFSFSFAGRALYVIGMHAHSSREARRFRWPAMVFNPHEQFERLRADGKWSRMRETIRARDLALQGSINPMLSDFGQTSEARQYSGRAVEEDWTAPFVPAIPKNAGEPAPGKCPFAH